MNIRCPKCGEALVLRTNRTTNEKFYGCSTYPKCKGTISLDNAKSMSNDLNVRLIIHALENFKLHKSEYRVFMYIFSRTIVIGYGRLELDYKAMSEITGVSSKICKRIIKLLVYSKLINSCKAKHEGKSIVLLSINKIGTWRSKEEYESLKASIFKKGCQIKVLQKES